MPYRRKRRGDDLMIGRHEYGFPYNAAITQAPPVRIRLRQPGDEGDVDDLDGLPKQVRELLASLTIDIAVRPIALAWASGRYSQDQISAFIKRAAPRLEEGLVAWGESDLSKMDRSRM